MIADTTIFEVNMHTTIKTQKLKQRIETCRSQNLSISTKRKKSILYVRTASVALTYYAHINCGVVTDEFLSLVTFTEASCVTLTVESIP